jgi:hypothetical protein
MGSLLFSPENKRRESKADKIRKTKKTNGEQRKGDEGR